MSCHETVIINHGPDTRQVLSLTLECNIDILISVSSEDKTSPPLTCSSKASDNLLSHPVFLCLRHFFLHCPKGCDDLHVYSSTAVIPKVGCSWADGIRCIRCCRFQGVHVLDYAFQRGNRFMHIFSLQPSPSHCL